MSEWLLTLAALHKKCFNGFWKFGQFWCKKCLNWNQKSGPFRENWLLVLPTQYTVSPSFWLSDKILCMKCHQNNKDHKKYQSCIHIRWLILHPVWHTQVGGWQVWHVTTWHYKFLPNANCPIWCTKTSIFYSGLLARIFIVLVWWHFMQRIFCDSQKEGENCILGWQN